MNETDRQQAIRFRGRELLDATTGEVIAAYDSATDQWRTPDGTVTFGLELPAPRLSAAITSTARAARNREHDAAWLSASVEQVRGLAMTKREFSTDEVWAVLDFPPRENRQIGVLMNACKAEGLIEATDIHVKTTRPSANRRPVRVWRSLVLDPSQPPSGALF